MRRLFIPVLLALACSLFGWSQQSGNPSHPEWSRDTTFPGDHPKAGDSSSMEDRIDVSPPPNDAREHPDSSPDPDEPYTVHSNKELKDNTGITEFKPFDPHKAQKAVEIGDFYLKRKNYRAAESRYREALYWKDNDAVATIRLAQVLEKLGQPDEAAEEYQSYLKILPHGPEAEEAKKALDRLKGTRLKSKK